MFTIRFLLTYVVTGPYQSEQVLLSSIYWQKLLYNSCKKFALSDYTTTLLFLFIKPGAINILRFYNDTSKQVSSYSLSCNKLSREKNFSMRAADHWILNDGSTTGKLRLSLDKLLKWFATPEMWQMNNRVNQYICTRVYPLSIKVFDFFLYI